jgi:glycosyltransferase involved in cell wall biosynthesis
LERKTEINAEDGVILAFDTWIFRNSHRHSGIYNYAKNLLKVFRRTADVRDDFSMRLFYTEGYSDQDVDFSASAKARVVNTPLLNYHRLWQLGAVAAIAARSGANVLFSPTTHTCPFGPVPVVTTIHDVTPLRSPSFGGLQNILERIRMRNAAKFSAKCITDSECSKRDLIESYGIPEEKVSVVHLGYDRETFNAHEIEAEKQKALLARYGIRKPYLLHHGALQPRKNLVRLIGACKLLWDRRKDFDAQLVLAGPKGWKYEPIFAAASQSGFEERIVFTGALPDEELALLLKGSMLSVMPSLYEGFCLPMVEAMACGVPTVAANASCLPEVSGGVLRYFDPESEEDIASVMENAIDDAELRRELATAGLKRVEVFSWQRCAEESLQVLRECRA